MRRLADGELPGALPVASGPLRGVAAFVDDVLSYDATWVLEVWCGAGDFTRGLLDEARERGRRIEIVALDESDDALAMARARGGGDRFVRYVRADARALPFPDGCFDIVASHLAIHRFEPETAIEVLREMRRVARVTPIVCDLERSRRAAFAASTIARFEGRSRPNPYDASLAVKRAYTMDELDEFARLAGWENPNLRRSGFFHVVLRDGA